MRIKHACIILFTVALLFLPQALTGTAVAQETEPPIVNDIGIALLFYKMTRQEPDFEKWVEGSPEYQSASTFHRAEIVQERTKEIHKLYGLTLPLEPFYIKVRVPISEYSADQKGMMIYSFNSQNFFDYVYMGQSYALIPSSISRFQWIRVDAYTAADIWEQADENGYIQAVFKMAPLSAHKQMMRMKGKNYRLLMAEVQGIQIWSKDKKMRIWESPADKRKNPLLKLWQ